MVLNRKPETMPHGSVCDNRRTAFTDHHSQAAAAVSRELDGEPLVRPAGLGREDDHFVLRPLLNRHLVPHSEVALDRLREKEP